jgi:hypothetical protein
MTDLDTPGLIVLSVPPGLQFRSTGKSVFGDTSDMSPQKIQEAWRDCPQWGSRSRTPCTEGQGLDPQIGSVCSSDPSEVQP